MIFNMKQMFPMRKGPDFPLILDGFFLPYWIEADRVSDPHNIFLQDQSCLQTVELRTIALYNSKWMEQWYDA